MKEVKVETGCEGKNSPRQMKGSGAYSRPQERSTESPGHFQETVTGGESKVMAIRGAQECGPLVYYDYSMQSAIVGQPYQVVPKNILVHAT